MSFWFVWFICAFGSFLLLTCLLFWVMLFAVGICFALRLRLVWLLFLCLRFWNFVLGFLFLNLMGCLLWCWSCYLGFVLLVTLWCWFDFVVRYAFGLLGCFIVEFSVWILLGFAVFVLWDFGFGLFISWLLIGGVTCQVVLCWLAFFCLVWYVGIYVVNFVVLMI